MTDVLRTMIRENALHSKSKLQTTDKVFMITIKNNNLLKSALRNVEIKYFSYQLDLHKYNLSNSWRVLKPLSVKIVISPRKGCFYMLMIKLLLIARTLLTNLTIYLYFFCQ